MCSGVFSGTRLSKAYVGNIVVNIAETDPCSSFPCKNDGACTKVTNLAYTCSCLPGWTGANCEEGIQLCLL